MKRQLWDIWKDGFIPSIPWRMLTPIGVLSYDTKRAAVHAKNTYMWNTASLMDVIRG